LPVREVSLSHSSKHEEMLGQFRDFYSAGESPAMRELERRVLGDDLDLLDVGSGAGWPGLFLGRESGCRVTLADITIEGPGMARVRAAREGIHARSIVASGELLPFRDRCFDAVTHSDVLC
jgi:ubiquinone/menaquinone biosynthesis C-methylase UbiE